MQEAIDKEHVETEKRKLLVEQLISNISQADVQPNEMHAFLFDIIRRYNGYKYVSVSRLQPAANDPNELDVIGIVQVHTTIPAVQADGTYSSIKDKFDCVVGLKDPDTFKGIIMNRIGEICIGDYFKPEHNIQHARV